jgi:catechol-2,3-dioxygenase
MKLDIDTIIIFVRDVDKLKSFYTGILHLDIIEESKSEWLLLKAGNCHIGLHRIGSQSPCNKEGEISFHSRFIK